MGVKILSGRAESPVRIRHYIMEKGEKKALFVIFRQKIGQDISAGTG